MVHTIVNLICVIEMKICVLSVKRNFFFLFVITIEIATQKEIERKKDGKKMCAKTLHDPNQICVYSFCRPGCACGRDAIN